MSLTKPNQELRRDLKQAAALLKWSGVDLLQVARKLSVSGLEDEAQELLKIAVSFQEVEDKLAGYVEDVNVGRILRGKAAAKEG
ncbi:hypothetical protein [Pseudomonas sp. S2_C03]